MTPEPCFESLSYKPFSVNGNLTVNAELDPDFNFFKNISSLDTQYFFIDDTKTFVNNNISSNPFSVLSSLVTFEIAPSRQIFFNSRHHAKKIFVSRSR